MKKNNQKNKLETEKKYNSIVDEFRRHKRLAKKFRLTKKDCNFIWDCLLTTFKATFKIKRDLELNLEFGLKIQNIHTNYKITTFDPTTKELQIDWKNHQDLYWLKFKIKKSILNKPIIKITEHVYRSTPFWGLQDVAGIWLLKKNFKKQMKQFVKGLKLVIANNNSIPDEINESI